MQSETAVLVMSDLHYGKVTPSFNPEVFESRLRSLSAKVRRVRELLSGYELDSLVVCLLGDVNDGTDIYATQPHHQAVSDVRQQALDFSGLMRDFLLDQAEAWGRVTVHCVPGNHGRAGKRVHEAANWDLVAYDYLRMGLAGDGRVEVNVPDSREGDPFIRVVNVRGHGYLLYHGHDIRSFSNIPWYGMMLRLMRWRSTAAFPPWRVACMGHFHTLGAWRFNQIVLLATGTMVSDDEWALRSFGWESATQCWLFGASDSRPVTWSFALDYADVV